MIARAMTSPALSSRSITTDWRESLPILTGRMVTLRELELGDAAALRDLVTTAEVARFIPPPPTTLEAFEAFIAWACHERRSGQYVCFAVVPHGMNTAVGLFQVRPLEGRFATAEWGFAIGSSFWGTGMFTDGADLTLEFAFGVLGSHRLEARAAVANDRGNGALRKLGAVQEAIVREGLLHRHRYIDQALWSIVESDWRRAKTVWGGKAAVH